MQVPTENILMPAMLIGKNRNADIAPIIRGRMQSAKVSFFALFIKYIDTDINAISMPAPAKMPLPVPYLPQAQYRLTWQ